MWPMLIALSPFYEDGVLGYFIGPDKKETWSKKSNQIYLDRKSQNKRFQISPNEYQLNNKSQKKAILIGRMTSSSGEAVVISLKSLENVQFFGETTSGYASANEALKMDENEYLVLTTAWIADAKMKTYPEGIQIKTPEIREDELLELVMEWLAGEAG